MKKVSYSLTLVSIMILLMPLPMSAQLEFVQHLVTDEFTKGADVIAVDLDQDGFTDIVATNSHTNAEVAWWQNNGENAFTKKVIIDNLNKGRSVRAADINDDQDIDLVAAVYGENRIIYLENQGEETFLEHTVDDGFIGAHTIDIKDMNEDGQPDILCSGFDFYGHNGEIAWWENDGADPITWTKHLVSNRFQQSPFVFGEDMDSDGDMDILACGELNDEILWWENDGNEVFTEHMVDNLINGIHTVIARDVDLDGDMDILAAACIGSRVVWYENIGSQGFTKHDLGYLAGALWLDAADLDNDGDQDLFAAPQGAANLYWWENPGDQQFIKRIIDSPFTQSFCVVPTLMDDDDDIDLVAIGWQSNKISWFENKLESLNFLNNPESVVFDSQNNRYLVSNWGNGDIIEIDSNGKQSIFNDTLDQAAGLHIVGNTLFAASTESEINGLVGFDLSSGEISCRVDIPEKQLLNDVTSDDNGNIYVTDCEADIIFKVNVSDSTYTQFVDSGLGYPNGIYFDQPNNRLLVLNGTLPYRPIVEVSLVDSTTSIVVETKSNGVDGLTADARGNFYFSSWTTDCVYRYDETFTHPPEVVSDGHINPADIFYNQEDEVLAVPNFNGNRVDLIPMSTTAVNHTGLKDQIKTRAYPNPFINTIRIEYSIESQSHVELNIYNLAGQCINNLVNGEQEKGTYQVDWNGENSLRINLQSGIYFCKFIAGKECRTIKLIKTD